MGKEVIYNKLKEIMISEFELNEGSLRPETHLVDDLDLDSMDMVDLILSLNDYIQEKIEPGIFKNARVMQDLVDIIQPYWKQDS